MAEEVKNEKQQTEKALDKMTVVELREAAKKEIPDIKGVSGMKKDQLLEVMKEAKGIKDVQLESVSGGSVAFRSRFRPGVRRIQRRSSVNRTPAPR